MGEPHEPEDKPVLDKLFRFTHGHRVRYDEVDAQGIVGNASWLTCSSWAGPNT